jgi:hypothetical protein
MQSYSQEQVINGTYGEVWVSGEYLAEVTSLEAKVTIDYADVNMTRVLAKHRKMTGWEGKGTVKLNKVTSFFINLLSSNTKAGKQTTCTIVSKLKDPNAVGAERVALKGVTFDEISLANWEAKKNGEESVGFGFTDWELLDVISSD